MSRMIYDVRADHIIMGPVHGMCIGKRKVMSVHSSMKTRCQSLRLIAMYNIIMTIQEPMSG